MHSYRLLIFNSTNHIRTFHIFHDPFIGAIPLSVVIALAEALPPAITAGLTCLALLDDPL